MAVGNHWELRLRGGASSGPSFLCLCCSVIGSHAMDVTSTEYVHQQVEESEAANKIYWDICIKRCPSKHSVQDVRMMATLKFTQISIGYKIE